jgi:hypothetical protein
MNMYVLENYWTTKINIGGRRMIDKEKYVQLMLEKPWQDMETYFDSMEPYEPQPVCQLDIDPSQWIQYSIDRVEYANHQWEMPKAHYPEHAKKWAQINNTMGRNKQNTYELNYGLEGSTNQELIDMLGSENMEKLNVDPESVLIRLIVKMPGHGLAWHQDDAGRYAQKFPHMQLDANRKNTKGELKRLWWSVDDWHDGHAMQISKTVLTHWKAGQVFDIPFGYGHASTNFGYVPQYTVSFTGIVLN